jgi:hypothetical protein
MEHPHACVDCRTAWSCGEPDCPGLHLALCATCLDRRLSGSSTPLRVVLLERRSPVVGQLIAARREDLLRRLRRRGQTG